MFSSNDNQANILKIAATGAIIAGGLMWSMTKLPEPLKMKNADYDNQSVVVDKENFTRTSQFPKVTELSRGNFHNIKTLYDIFQCGMMHAEHEPCLGYKPDINSADYRWLTYREVESNACKLGAGIITRLNQSPGQSTRIGIFMKNCVEWIYIEQSCTRYSMVIVPFYDTLGEEACKYAINFAKCEVIFVDTKKKIDCLVKMKSEIPHLKYIVSIVDLDDDIIQEGIKNDLQFVPFSEIMIAGEKNPVPLSLPTGDDISTIFFTSGTTGIPKGCVITHHAIITSICSVLTLAEILSLGKNKEVHLSFLPLTHVYERLIHILMFMYSGKIAFFSGDVRNLGEEIKKIKPTVLFAVPRILNRIYDKVMSSVNSSPLIKYVFNIAYSSKLKEVKRGIIRKNSFWDYVLFRRIQSVLGGNIQFIQVGSAPVSGDVLDFFRVVMSCLVIEGYGQTETTGPITITLPGDNNSGQVGVPVPGATIKLCDVPELQIVVSRDLRGEICVKGDMCIKEYFHDETMTQQLIDPDGWLHTGDVGLWNKKGQLEIVDRCKHILKMSQGEYLAPERLENIYCLSPLVVQIFVTGDSLKDYCVAIVMPDIDGWKSLDKKYDSIQSICDDKQSPTIIQRDLETIGRNNKLFGFEIVKKVTLSSTIMTVENDMLSPTLKLKRAVAERVFANEIKAMYN